MNADVEAAVADVRAALARLEAMEAGYAELRGLVRELRVAHAGCVSNDGDGQKASYARKAKAVEALLDWRRP